MAKITKKGCLPDIPYASLTYQVPVGQTRCLATKPVAYLTYRMPA